jgi:hypothetical protein
MRHQSSSVISHDKSKKIFHFHFLKWSGYVVPGCDLKKSYILYLSIYLFRASSRKELLSELKNHPVCMSAGNSELFLKCFFSVFSPKIDLKIINSQKPQGVQYPLTPSPPAPCHFSFLFPGSVGSFFLPFCAFFNFLIVACGKKQKNWVCFWWKFWFLHCLVLWKSYLWAQGSFLGLCDGFLYDMFDEIFCTGRRRKALQRRVASNKKLHLINGEIFSCPRCISNFQFLCYCHGVSENIYVKIPDCNSIS